MPPRKPTPADPAGSAPDDARGTGIQAGAPQEAETGFLADCEAVAGRLKGLLPMQPGEDSAAQARLLFQPWRDFAARYRVLRSCLPQDSMADDSGWRQVDRQVSLVTGLLTPPLPADAETGKAQLRLAGLLIGQIIEREEAAETSLVAKARSAGLESDDLERWLAAFAEDRDPPSWSPAQKRPSMSTEEAMMPRTTNTPERDDRGRFVGDDDRGGGYRSSGRDRDRDEQGRFASDDDRGGYRSRSGGGSSGRERDEQGRFTSDYDRRYSRGRDDDDDRRYSRGRQDDDRGSGQGWYGDSRGHSEAARMGWEHRRGDDDYDRGRSSSRHDDDDRRYSRGYDDDRGGGYRSSGRERDEQGRFTSGDDYGSRGGGYRSGGRERDEQGRFAGDDDRRHSRGYDDDRGGGRGQGGWFGDARGHSEASRMGWERRRDDDDDDRGRYRR